MIPNMDKVLQLLGYAQYENFELHEEVKTLKKQALATQAGLDEANAKVSVLKHREIEMLNDLLKESIDARTLSRE